MSGAEVGHGIKGLIDPAFDYAHQLNILKMANIGAKETADATRAAWQNTGKVISTTATQNLAMITDMRGVLTGGTEEAIKMLPIVSKIATVMAASSETNIKTNSGQIAFSIAKAMDIMGLNTPAEMEHGSIMLSKVVTAFQNRVDPSAFAATSFYMRQARYGHDDFFRYGVIPAMMLERSGPGGGIGSRGIGPQLAAINRVTTMGVMTKGTAAWFSQLGLLKGRILPTSTTRTLTQGLQNQSEWTSNPFVATWQRLVPAIASKYGVTPQIGEGGQIMNAEALRAVIAQSKMTQNAMSQFMEWVTKPANFLRDAANVGVLPPIKELPPLLRNIAEKLGLKDHAGAMDYEQAYSSVFAQDPKIWEETLSAEWKNLRAAMAVTLVPGIIGVMRSIAGGMQNASQWAVRHPHAAGLITEGAVGVGGILAAGIAIRGLATLPGMGLAARGIAAMGGALGVLAALPGLGTAAAGIMALTGAIKRVGESTEQTKGWLNSFAKPGAVLPTSVLPKGLTGLPQIIDLMEASALRRAYGGMGYAPDVNDEFGRRRIDPQLQTKYPGLSSLGDRAGYSDWDPVKREATAAIPVAQNVTLEGQTTLSGNLVINMGELGTMIQRYVLQGITRAMGNPAATPARPDGAHLEPPT